MMTNLITTKKSKLNDAKVHSSKKKRLNSKREWNAINWKRVKMSQIRRKKNKKAFSNQIKELERSQAQRNIDEGSFGGGDRPSNQMTLKGIRNEGEANQGRLQTYR